MDILDSVSSYCGTHLPFEFIIGSSTENNWQHRKPAYLPTSKIENLRIREIVIDTVSRNFIPTMKQLYSVSEPLFTHNASVFPVSPQKQHGGEEYVLICDKRACNCFSEAENVNNIEKSALSESKSKQTNGIFAVNTCVENKDSMKMDNMLNSATCDKSFSEKEMVQVKRHYGSNPEQVVKVELQEQAIKTFTPKRSVSNIPISLCQQSQRKPESPSLNFYSSPKYCSTPVSHRCNSNPHSNHRIFNNESSIYEELLDAEGELCDFPRQNAMCKKYETFSLSSNYYSASDSSENNSFIDSDSSDYVQLRKAIQKPLNCSSVENLLEETHLVQQALWRYKKELDVSEARFDISYMILEDELSEGENECFEELKSLRSEVRQEIERMEEQLIDRKKSLNEGNQNFNPLACLQVVEKMMDLLNLSQQS